MASLGHCVEIIEGIDVMSTLGIDELETEGSPEGKSVDLLKLGAIDGVDDFSLLGPELCSTDGLPLCCLDGSFDISFVGCILGCGEGSPDGVDDGTEENSPVGCAQKYGFG